MAVPILPIVQAGVGLGQLIAGASMKNKRPGYAGNENLDKQEQLARNRLANPYAEADRAREANRMAISNNIDAIRSGKTSGRVNESAIFGAAMRGEMNVSDRVDANKRIAEASLSQVLMNQHRYGKEKWEWEKRDKFKERAAAKSELIGSGIHNAFGAIGGIADSRMQQQYLKSLRGPDAPTAMAKKGPMTIPNPMATRGLDTSGLASNTSAFDNSPFANRGFKYR